MWGLYKVQPSFVLGFHGCDEDVGREVVSGTKRLEPSANEYDWLGSGSYFWEGSPQRAQEWADAAHVRHPGVVRKPFVIGAVLDLGLCLNLTDRSALEEVAGAFEFFKTAILAEGGQLPVNKGAAPDKPLRYLDKAVFEFLHQIRHETQIKGGRTLPSYDTVRAPFFEGEVLYPGAAIQSKNHIQIAVRNLKCVKGYFLPIRESS